MLKKFASLLSLTLILSLTLMLLAGCGAKSRQATPEDLLQEMAGRWEVDIDASMQVDSFVRGWIDTYGEKDFVETYGQMGVGLNVPMQEFALYKSRDVVLDSWLFAIAPETPEDKAVREKGIHQLRLALDLGGEGPLIYVLRYGDSGKLTVFAPYGLIGIFSRLKE